MKKKICAAFLAACLLLATPVAAHAETSYGGSDWSVSFTSDRRMDSNFKTSDMDDVIRGMQPGDNAIITLNLKNSNTETTDWYLRNEVLYSLEDRSNNENTSGGAYTYTRDRTEPEPCSTATPSAARTIARLAKASIRLSMALTLVSVEAGSSLIPSLPARQVKLPLR